MALFFSRAVLGRICMLCLPVFAGCQLMHPASGSISCFPPCMQQRVGQLQIDLTHRDQLAEILTQNQTMQAGSAPIRFGCAAASRRSQQGRQGAAQPPAAHRRRFSAPLVGALFGDGLTVRYALQLSWCGSLGAPLRRPEHAHGRPPRAAAAAPPAAATATSGHWQLSLPPRLVPLSAHA
jgi:hypothetical protein